MKGKGMMSYNNSALYPGIITRPYSLGARLHKLAYYCTNCP